MDPDASEMAEHYREQTARLRIMAALLPGAELKANLRAAARMYEDFAEKLETPGRPMVPIERAEGSGGPARQ
jgi:hypothetical protein